MSNRQSIAAKIEFEGEWMVLTAICIVCDTARMGGPPCQWMDCLGGTIVDFELNGRVERSKNTKYGLNLFPTQDGIDGQSRSGRIGSLCGIQDL